MKLSTQDKPFLPHTWEEKLLTVQKLGFDAFEIDGGVLIKEFDAVQKATESTGIPISSICGGYRGWIGHFEEDKRQLCIRDIEEMLKAGQILGVKGIVIPAAWGMFSLRLPPMVPPRSREEDRCVLLDALSALDVVAGQTHTLIFLEPLNRYEDHMINTVATARSLIEQGSLKHTMIAADFFHMNIEEDHISDQILQHRSWIGHIHIADSNRFQPGAGHTDFLSGFSILTKTYFDGYMAFECRVLGEDLYAAYRNSVGFIRDLITKASSMHE